MCGVNYGNDIHVFIYVGYLFIYLGYCLLAEHWVSTEVANTSWVED